jgi:lysophospholipase
MHEAYRRPYAKMRAESICDRGYIAFLRAGDGLRLRCGCWPARTARGRGTVLLLGGRAEFLEKYIEVIDELTSRGYSVCGFDWRGQGLSGRMPADAENCLFQNYDRYLTDLDLILNRLVYPRRSGPVLLLAHSMGAHIALRYLDQTHHNIACAVLTAPMIDIKTGLLPPSWVRRISSRMVKIGLGRQKISVVRRHNPFTTTFARNRLTSDRVRFERAQHFVLQNPALKDTDVTFGWLTATFASIDRIKAAAFGARIDIPMLMILAGRDRVVSNQAALALAPRLPGLNLHIIGGARHEILQERDLYRDQFWSHFDCFAP